MNTTAPESDPTSIDPKPEIQAEDKKDSESSLGK